MQSNAIGLILAGGMARRFGESKALASLRGKPLIFWVREALEVVCEEVWLSLRSPEQPEFQLKEQFARLVLDPFPGAGPLAGLLAGLSSLPLNKILLVATCDQPLLKVSLLKGLLEQAIQNPEKWAVCCLRKDFEPFPGVYRRELLSSLQKALLSSQRSVRRWIRQLPPQQVLGLPYKVWYSWDREGLSFSNVNRKEELKQLESFIS